MDKKILTMVQNTNIDRWLLNTLLPAVILTMLIMLPIAGLLHLAKADSTPYYAGEREDILYVPTPIEPTVELVAPTYYTGEREGILCTQDCAVRPVEVCTDDDQFCTYVDGLFCTQKIGNSCEQVLTKLLD